MKQANSTISEAAAWFRLIPQYTQSHLAINGRELSDFGDRYKYWSSTPLDHQYIELFNWKVSIDKPPKDLIGNNLSWLIFTERAKRTIEVLPHLVGDFIELPEAILKNARNRCRTWLFRPRHCAPVLDVEHSKLAWSTSGNGKYISTIHEMRIRPEVAQLGSALFRLEEDPSYIILSRQFWEAWQRADCTGIRFEPVTTSLEPA